MEFDGITIKGGIVFFIGEAVEFETFAANVYEQSNFKVVRFQIIDSLCHVHVFQLGKSF